MEYRTMTEEDMKALEEYKARHFDNVYQHISNTIEGMFEIAKAARHKDFNSEGLTDTMVELIHELNLMDVDLYYLDDRRCNPKF